MTRVLVVATSRKTRGGITSVIKAHETGEQWKKYHCRWIETHRDGPAWRKVLYFVSGTISFLFLLPFYDIVHMHVSFAGSLSRKCFYMRICKLLQKKTIVHFHPPSPDVLLDPKATGKYRFLFSSADKVIVLSKSWVEHIKNYIYNGEKDNISVLYNPCPSIDASLVIPISKREKYILFAGTLIERKGYKCLIKAFSTISESNKEWQLLLAGVDEDMCAKDIIKELGLEKQIILKGWCDDKQIKELYRHASIVCLPSSGEGFPMVVLEAWAYGTPVICTPVGGLPDIIEEGKNALSFDYNDEKKLSNHLKFLIENESERETLSNGGLMLAKEVFNINLINQQLGTIYESLK